MENNRHNNTLPLKDILSEYIKQPVIKKGIGDSQAVKAWGAVLGASISRITTNIYVKDGVLFVSLSSSVIRHELFLNKRKIIVSINEYVGSNVIHDIILR